MRKEGRRRERARKKGRDRGWEGNHCFSVERNW